MGVVQVNLREQRSHMSGEPRTNSHHEHDHAWVRVHPAGQHGLALGEYRCKVCAVVWRL
jgi:hypothetical protein